MHWAVTTSETFSLFLCKVVIILISLECSEFLTKSAHLGTTEGQDVVLSLSLTPSLSLLLNPPFLSPLLFPFLLPSFSQKLLKKPRSQLLLLLSSRSVVLDSL